MLVDKAVVVTGAGGGLGRAYALECAARGASVVVNDIDEGAAGATVESIRGSGGRAAGVIGSVAAWDVAAQLVSTCLDTFGHLDGFVNNAGVILTGRAWEAAEADLRAIVEVNVLGAMYCARHAMAAMVDTGGSIVNIVSGAQSGMEGLSAYGGTKGALTALTLGWALEGSEAGIRVNAVSPIARTAMTPRAPDGSLAVRPAPESVAPLIGALLSDACADVNARIYRFDGHHLGIYEPLRLGETLEARGGWATQELLDALHRLAGI